ncbi:hypothetical protein M1M07_00025 [Rhodococcus sp. HM1]|uniref:hypothetical protein n=1 Tax=Rhodococcus sp. HM1 TaxID=2937759 RepID=UPI00200AFDF0|nr:hypothetical protein [Rhodococcus sp. HM1]MCK8669501.1 hypothetical protein [Rhodococcus sp. HM1]
MTDPTPIYRSDLLASGITPDELRQALRSGALTPVAPGAYLRRAEADALDDDARHRVRGRCVQHTLGWDAVLSHVTAALFHGADLWNPDLSRIHITRDRRSGGRRTDNLHVHPAPIAREEIFVVGAAAVTSPARTIVDLARSLPVDEAVIAGDSLLRRYPSALVGIPAALDGAALRAGVASARRVVDFLDGRSESAGESLGRLRLRSAGIPEPSLQRELFTPDGTFVARVDFFWEELGIVGEFDGMGKYGAGDPESTAESVHREKLREDAIRGLGFEVVRWTWAELFRFDVVADRFARAAERARHSLPPTAKTPARCMPRATVYPARG